MEAFSQLKFPPPSMCQLDKTINQHSLEVQKRGFFFFSFCCCFLDLYYIDALLLFLDKVCSPSWAGTHYVDQAGLKLTEICQPLPLKY